MQLRGSDLFSLVLSIISDLSVSASKNIQNVRIHGNTVKSPITIGIANRKSTVTKLRNNEKNIQSEQLLASFGRPETSHMINLSELDVIKDSEDYGFEKCCEDTPVVWRCEHIRHCVHRIASTK